MLEFEFRQRNFVSHENIHNLKIKVNLLNLNITLVLLKNSNTVINNYLNLFTAVLQHVMQN